MGGIVVNGGDLNKVCVSCMYCGFNYNQIKRNLFWLIELHNLKCEREPEIEFGDKKVLWNAFDVKCNGGSPVKESE